MGKIKRGRVCGVGVYEKGRHPGSVGTRSTREYKLWQRMLERCYSEKHHEIRPTYIGCSVDKRFLHFQEFMDWAVVQNGYGLDGWALDKDLLVKGNKVYSPEACVFLPASVNTGINLIRSRRTQLPVGVFIDDRHPDRYYAMMNGDGKAVRLGTYSTPEEAFLAFKIAREGKIKALAETYKASLDPRAYSSLLAWEVNIDD